MNRLLHELKAKKQELQDLHTLVVSDTLKFTILDNKLKHLKAGGIKFTRKDPRIIELIRLGDSIGYTKDSHIRGQLVIEGKLTLLDEIINSIENHITDEK